MHESEVVSARFAPVIDALVGALSSLDMRADRAELLVAVMRSFELWVKDNVAEEPRTQMDTMTTEYETAETLTQAMRSYWLQCMGGTGGRGAFGQSSV